MNGRAFLPDKYFDTYFKVDNNKSGNILRWDRVFSSGLKHA